MPDEEALRIMGALYVEGSVIWERFRNPVQYLHERRQTETWLRQGFIAKGGSPKDAYPVYTVLGRSRWMLKMADPATLATTAEIQIPLLILRECDVSFTYPDSMISHWFGRDKPPEFYQPDYHGRVFTLSEMLSIVRQKGLPDEGWETNAPSPLAHYIEAQIWNRALLRVYLQQAGG